MWAGKSIAGGNVQSVLHIKKVKSCNILDSVKFWQGIKFGDFSQNTVFQNLVSYKFGNSVP